MNRCPDGLYRYYVRKPHGPFEETSGEVYVPPDSQPFFIQYAVNLGEVVRAYKAAGGGWWVQKWPVVETKIEGSTLSNVLFTCYFRLPTEDEMALIKLRELNYNE